MLALAALSTARRPSRAVALDVFGDADTRRHAADWQPIGTPQAMRIAGDRFLAALEALARREIGRAHV